MELLELELLEFLFFEVVFDVFEAFLLLEFWFDAFLLDAFWFDEL